MFILFNILFGILLAGCNCQMQYRGCTAIYIPEDKQDGHSIFNFYYKDVDGIAILYATGNWDNYHPRIFEGKKIKLSSGRHILIDLENNNDHICDCEYANSERKVNRIYGAVADRVGTVVGYIYRNDEIPQIILSGTDYDLYDIARRSVVKDGDSHSPKRSKYLAVCITGADSDYASNQCYGLEEGNAIKAYVNIPFTLKSNIDRSLKGERKKVWWGNPLHMFVARIDTAKSNLDSICYGKRKRLFVSEYEGRLHQVSDSFYSDFHEYSGHVISANLFSQTKNYDNLPKCITGRSRWKFKN